MSPLISGFSALNLRVVDASAMPSIVCGNTYVAFIAIAERAADILQGNRPAEAPHLA